MYFRPLFCFCKKIIFAHEMELTKAFIKTQKNKSENALKKTLQNFQNQERKLVFILENTGMMPQNFKGDWLFDFAKHKNAKIRRLAIKNIGKIKLQGTLNALFSLLEKEENSEIRREIVSAMGRQRNKNAINFLIAILKDKDPKIVCQAIRGLLIFRKDKKIVEILKKMKNHKNEMVQNFIEKEFFLPFENKNKLPHPETYDFLKNTVVHGDVRKIIKSVPEDSVHLTFTSPPYYNARDYSIYPSYKDYLFFLEEVFKEVHRITKEGRFLLINTSPIIIPRISRQHSSKRYPIPFDLHSYIVKMGWEYVDDIIWLKPEPSVKNRVGGFQQHRKPLAYKPNTVTEMIMVYRKKTSKLLDWNIRQYPKEIVEKSKVANGFETSNVWNIDPVYSKNHSAVFPVALCKKILQYYSFEGDLVFDPFAGSGTFGKTAKALNRYFFLTEMNIDYFNYIRATKEKHTLFKQQETKFLTQENFSKITKIKLLNAK